MKFLLDDETVRREFNVGSTCKKFQPFNHYKSGFFPSGIYWHSDADVTSVKKREHETNTFCLPFIFMIFSYW